MIEDLTMLANLPVCEDEAANKEREDKVPDSVPDSVPIVTAQSEADKARRGQDAPEQEAVGEEDRG